MKPTLIALTTLLASAITAASGKGVALADIETLYAEASRVTNLGENRKNGIWLLLKNGQAYQNLSVSPADFDVDTTRQHEPDKWYSWRKTDDGYQIRKNGAWQKLQGRRVLPGKAGETLHGSYSHNASDTLTTPTSRSIPPSTLRLMLPSPTAATPFPAAPLPPSATP